MFHALVNSLPRYKAPVALETVTWTQSCRYTNPLAINENTLATLHICVTNIFKNKHCFLIFMAARAHPIALHTGQFSVCISFKPQEKWLYKSQESSWTYHWDNNPPYRGEMGNTSWGMCQGFKAGLLLPCVCGAHHTTGTAGSKHWPRRRQQEAWGWEWNKTMALRRRKAEGDSRKQSEGCSQQKTRHSRTPDAGAGGAGLKKKGGGSYVHKWHPERWLLWKP